MRIAVLADIHGNRLALEAVLDDCRRQAVNAFIIAGDLTAGPQGDECIRLLRSLPAWIICGNSDLNLLRLAAGEAPPEWYSRKQYALLRWNLSHLSDDSLAFLGSLPQQSAVHLADAPAIRVVHGSPVSPWDGLSPEEDLPHLDECLAMIREAVLVCGHTHISWHSVRGRKIALNPGAVCGPLNGETGAQYALLQWDRDRWQAELLNATYDLAENRRAFAESGLLEEGGGLAKAFLLSIESGQNVGMHFLDHAYRLAAENGFTGMDIVPDCIYDAAVASFDWQAYN